ncbi:MAG: homoserine dehydrogenase [Chloroflexota bacterium]|nr:homoserine dehydrogenase [Chloroflexota bacterium]
MTNDQVKPQLRVSLLGFGRVGSNVYRLLMERQAEIERITGQTVVVAHILVKDQAELEAVDAERSLLTTDIAEALDTDVVVEMIGRQEPARSYVLDAIASGCDVVTSNRELVIAFAEELFTAVKREEVQFLFGATVGTATPILELVHRHLAVAGIDGMIGIFTGSANYVLAEMDKKLLRSEDVLPTLTPMCQPDLTGWDSASKIALVSAAAFGVRIQAADIPAEGIEKVKLTDVAYAMDLGYRLRLLGLARRDGKRIFAAVFPALIPADSLLTRTGKESIMVTARGPAFGEVTLRGPGAGGLPTACAVVADVVSLAQGFKRATLDLGAMSHADLAPIEEQSFAFYARLRLESTKVTRFLSRLRELHVTASVKREEAIENLEIVIITDPMPDGLFRAVLKDLQNSGIIVEVKAVYRIVHPYS